MLEVHAFEAGDPVPEWIERVDPPDAVVFMRFNQNCFAIKAPEGVYVLKRNMDPGTWGGPQTSIISFQGNGKPANIIGAPTEFVGVQGLVAEG